MQTPSNTQTSNITDPNPDPVSVINSTEKQIRFTPPEGEHTHEVFEVNRLGQDTQHTLHSEAGDIVPPAKKKSDKLDNKNDNSSVQLLGTVGGLKSPGSSVSVEEENRPAIIYNYFCVGCGNEKAECLDCLFGEFCIQECLTLYDNLGKHDCTDDKDEDEFMEKFNVQVCLNVLDEHEVYDKKDIYELPSCVVEGSLKEAKYLIDARKAFSDAESKRKYAASLTYYSFDTKHFDD